MRTPLLSLVTLSAITLALSACGQKGPLYLPQDPAAPSAGTTGTVHSQTTPAQQNSQTGTETESNTDRQTEQHTEAEAVSK
ncbi:LPS translocon maturation chaperone LptM [Microbulbifer elongatus]|uniref:LPS translocon maturation chaperone LptM n=1 Tax=Microbulbifer elongatus TaxID=86173 RepID=UPI001E617C14|nr:lipoprotein [Microbulbifer elongatus]